MKTKREDPVRKESHLFLSHRSHDSLDFDAQSDQEICQALKSGSSVALKYIYNHYADLLYAYGKKFSTDNQLVEDCLHDLFVELWSRRNSSTPIKDLKAYLLTCFRRKVIQAEKKLSRFERITSHQKFEMDLSGELSGLTEKKEVDLDQLKNALNDLPQRQKEALYLRFYNHLSCKDIAEIMSVNRQSVYNMLHKALVMLKNKFAVLVALLDFIALS